MEAITWYEDAREEILKKIFIELFGMVRNNPTKEQIKKAYEYRQILQLGKQCYPTIGKRIKEK